MNNVLFEELQENIGYQINEIHFNFFINDVAKYYSFISTPPDLSIIFRMIYPLQINEGHKKNKMINKSFYLACGRLPLSVLTYCAVTLLLQID